MSMHSESNYLYLRELERKLIQRERQVEMLQVELQKATELIRELRQGMRPVGTIEEVRGDQAYVKIAGNQIFQVTIPPRLVEKASPDMYAVLSPTKGVVLEVTEKPKERSIWEHRMEKAPDLHYGDVVGLKTELKELRKSIEWVISPEIRARRERIIKDRGLLEEVGSLLLFGPPGTGKTYMAKAISGTISAQGQETSFVKIEGYEMVSKWLGESARNVKGIFGLARECAPSILFFDEVDAIGRARTEAATDAGRDVQGMLNQLLTELGEGFEVNRDVAVVFATNYPSVIDPALIDRVRKIIYVPPPKGREEVKAIFDYYLSKVEVDPRIMEDGRLKDEAFEELWGQIGRNEETYHASIPRRGISIRERYSITPRDVKNIVQEASSDAAFEDQEHLTLERLLKYTAKLGSENRKTWFY